MHGGGFHGGAHRIAGLEIQLRGGAGRDGRASGNRSPDRRARAGLRGLTERTCAPMRLRTLESGAASPRWPRPRRGCRPTRGGRGPPHRYPGIGSRAGPTCKVRRPSSRETIPAGRMFSTPTHSATAASAGCRKHFSVRARPGGFGVQHDRQSSRPGSRLPCGRWVTRMLRHAAVGPAHGAASRRARRRVGRRRAGGRAAHRAAAGPAAPPARGPRATRCCWPLEDVGAG